MTAYLFNVAAALAVLSLAVSFVGRSTVTRRLTGSSAGLLLLLGGWSLLVGSRDWVICAGWQEDLNRGKYAALRFGLHQHQTLAIVIDESLPDPVAAQSPQGVKEPQLSVDRVVHMKDPTQEAGAVLRLELTDHGEVAVWSSNDSVPVYVGGRIVRPGQRASIERGTHVVRWGGVELRLRREPVLMRFLPTLVLMTALLLWAGHASSTQGLPLVWNAALVLAAYGAILQARLGADQATPYVGSFRAAVATTSALAVLTIMHAAGPRRFLRWGILALGLAELAVLSVSGPAFIGAPKFPERAAWLLLPAAAVTLAPSFAGGVHRIPAIAKLRRAVIVGIAQGVPRIAKLLLILAPPAIAILGHLRWSGRFVLAVLLLWAWAHHVERLGHGSRRDSRSARALSLLPAWVWASGCCAFTDFGFGVVVAVALLVVPLIAAPRPLMKPAAGVVILCLFGGITCFALGLLPTTAVARIVGALNYQFGLGGAQLLGARLLLQEGSLWGTAWGPPRVLSLPQLDDDFAAVGLGFETGALGLTWFFGMFAIFIIALIWSAAHADFQHDEDASRRTFLTVGGFAALLVLLVGFNLCGVINALPLTGVPIPLISRSADAAIAVIFAVALATRTTLDRSTPVRGVTRDMRSVAVGWLAILLTPVVAGCWLMVLVAVSWLFEPETSWLVFHHLPTTATVATVERRVASHGKPVFELSSERSDITVLNGQPLDEGEHRLLSHGDELRLGTLLLELSTDQWNPGFRVKGWELAPRPGDPETTEKWSIGRIVYADHLWWLPGRTPDIAVSWDDQADLYGGSLIHDSGGWLLQPSPSPYRGVTLDSESDQPDPIRAPVRLPQPPAKLTLRFGETVCDLAPMPDGRLRVSLVKPVVFYPLSKVGPTRLGGGLTARHPAFRQHSIIDVRTQTVVRELIEEGCLALDGERNLVGAAPESRHHQALFRELRRFKWADLNGSTIRIDASHIVTARDGRPAGLSRSSLYQRVFTPPHQPRLILVDRQGRLIDDAEELGLTALVGGSTDSPAPGLRVLASALQERPDEVQRLSLSYPFVGFVEPEQMALVTTLDQDIQRVALDALAERAAHWRERVQTLGIRDTELLETTAAVLVLDGHNRILAVASTPTAANPDEFLAVLNQGRYDPRAEVLPFGEIPSGSTMKLACWPFFLTREDEFFIKREGDLYFKTWERSGDGGLIARRFFDTGRVGSFAGRRIPPVRNANGQAVGFVPFPIHVRESTNTALVAPFGLLGTPGMDDFTAAAGSYGMLREFLLLPDELTDPAGKWERHIRWSGRNRAVQPMVPDPFGNIEGGEQAGKSLAARVRFHLGDLSRVSALNIAVTMNTIANEGTFFRPGLISGIQRAGWRRDIKFPQPQGEQVMDSDVARHIGDALRLVAQPGGTAARAFAGSPLLSPEYNLMSKTGTPEHKRLVRRADGSTRLVAERSDKVFLASIAAHRRDDIERLTVIVYQKSAGPGGPGMEAIESLGAQECVREIMEALIEAPDADPPEFAPESADDDPESSQARRLWSGPDRPRTAD